MKMEKICNKALVLTASVILSMLTLFSFLFTQRCGKEELGEILNKAPIYQDWDNPLYHLLGAGALLGLLVLCLRRISWTPGKVLALQIGAAVLAGGVSAWLLLGGTRTPVDDQIQVCSAASLFNQGNFINLERGGYVNLYPQQLGLIAYIQVIYRIFGDGNFFAFQVINCFFIAGAVFFLGRCLAELTDHYGVIALGTFLSIPLLPLYLMSSWVYGDVPCLFFTFVFFRCFLRFCKCGRPLWLAVMTASVCLCLALRKHSLIIIIAGVIALLLCFWRQRKRIFLTGAALVIIAPLLLIFFIEKGYEAASGYKVDGGLPGILWVAMGISEDASKPGWFHNYCVPVYYSVDCDRDAAAGLGRLRIEEKLELFRENPVYGLSFYKRKICTQWNDPFYNTNFLAQVDQGAQGTGITGFVLKHEDGVRVFLSVYQALLYLGALLCCIRKAGSHTVGENVLLIAFVGGFLFSILWEGNSRYVFPYVTMLVPMAGIGWGSLLRVSAAGKEKLFSESMPDAA